jgi:DNA-3-methyladenine glycosylase
MLSRSFFDRDVLTVARDLIGATLLVDGVGGTIVETEAYDREDPASHSYNGPTARNAAMFGPPGHAYVYRSYGIHWCLNFVCGRAGVGSAVLIRAVAPTAGIDIMRVRREIEDIRKLCAGPGRLCQALAITRAFNGHALDMPPFALEPSTTTDDVVIGPRIGITRGRERPWRYGAAQSPFLSRPFPMATALEESQRRKKGRQNGLRTKR